MTRWRDKNWHPVDSEDELGIYYFHCRISATFLSSRFLELPRQRGISTIFPPLVQVLRSTKVRLLRRSQGCARAQSSEPPGCATSVMMFFSSWTDFKDFFFLKCIFVFVPPKFFGIDLRNFSIFQLKNIVFKIFYLIRSKLDVVVKFTAYKFFESRITLAISHKWHSYYKKINEQTARIIILRREVENWYKKKKKKWWTKMKPNSR